ncbi:SDR family oxidoreductase [Leucobacter triazinivorans]|uniref:SDR family oxidoreductase n=1 Tax=Leucobacter triazinivorans TaxID=1784719 RepID=A0A4P6KIY6_9MICO|nr:SDR family oxidoreductase [Leucobacter triazinivorans]QBE49978.1 SDR family oxidoreductase [Leucobacter triazinivorans]
MSQTITAERTALVTGATGVIGSAIVRGLVADGIRTALIARNARHLERLEHSLDAPHLTLRLRADVAEPFDLLESRDAIRDRFGSDPDLLVVAAGILRTAPFRAAAPADWNAMIRTNLQGALHTVQTFTEGLVSAAASARPADLVLIGAAHARQRSQTYAVFSSLAAAIEQLSRHLRTELGPRGVRVHHLAPQFIESDSPSSRERAEPASSEPASSEPRVWDRRSPGPQRTAELVRFAISLPHRANLAEAVLRIGDG